MSIAALYDVFTKKNEAKFLKMPRVLSSEELHLCLCVVWHWEVLQQPAWSICWKGPRLPGATQYHPLGTAWWAYISAASDCTRGTLQRSSVSSRFHKGRGAGSVGLE